MRKDKGLRSESENTDGYNPIVFGHRGASGIEVENTYRSFDRAIEIGADGLESDCWLLKDGKVVLFHDKFIPKKKESSHIIDINRKLDEGDTSEAFNIRKLTSDQLQSLSFPNGEKIPLLDEFFEKYLEAKSSRGELVKFSLDCQDLRVYKKIIDLIKTYNLYERVFLCSTNLLTLHRIRQTDPKVQSVASNLGTNISESQLRKDGKISNLGISAFNIQACSLKAQQVNLLRRYGYGLFVWDLHTKEDLQSFFPFRPDAIYSNYPDIATRIRDEYLSGCE